MRIGKHLHFHVARVHQCALDQQVAIAKAGQRLGAGAGQGSGQLRGFGHQAHAAPAATGHRLDHHRIAHPLCLAGKARLALVIARVARQAGHVVRQGQRLGGRFAAQRADGGGRRADPGQPRIDHGLRKTGVFAQEPIARVHRIGAGGARGLQQPVNAQVAFGRGAATQREGDRCLLHMQRMGVRV